MTELTGAFEQSTCRALDGDEDRRNYQRFQYELIEPYCGPSVLEIGAGTGALASHFTGHPRRVVTDVDVAAVQHLLARFASEPSVEVRPFNLLAGDVLEQPVDTAIAVNVLEHIRDDVTAVGDLAKSVVPGGTLVLWVPAYDWLYGDFDRKVGHFRRYTPVMMWDLVEDAGLRMEMCRPVNLLGALAWWVAVRKGGTGSPRPRMVRFYDRVLVPPTRVLERLFKPPFGQSILCVARVPTAGERPPPRPPGTPLSER